MAASQAACSGSGNGYPIVLSVTSRVVLPCKWPIKFHDLLFCFFKGITDFEVNMYYFVQPIRAEGSRGKEVLNLVIFVESVNQWSIGS